MRVRERGWARERERVRVFGNVLENGRKFERVRVFGNVLENGRKFERVRVVGNGLGNVVGRGFRNVCAIANAFSTSSNTHANPNALPALQGAYQRHLKRCANNVARDTRSHVRATQGQKQHAHRLRLCW